MRLGGKATPFVISIGQCPAPPYEDPQLQQPEACCAPLQPPPHVMQQLLVPSNQGSSQKNPLREEVGEVGSKGALESFSPTFATELLADIELEGEEESPAAAAAAAAAGGNSLLMIEVPVQRANPHTGRNAPF